MVIFESGLVLLGHPVYVLEYAWNWDMHCFYCHWSVCFHQIWRCVKKFERSFAVVSFSVFFLNLWKVNANLQWLQ